MRLSLRLEYLTQFSGPMRPFIIHMKDVQADGNCGLRAIADMLSFDEDGLAQVRCDLLKKMHVYAQLYESVYDSAECLEEIRHSLNHFEGEASYDHWMVMSEIGYLISSHYNVVLLLLSLHQSLTFLPLWTETILHAARRNIAIGFVNNHFIEVGYFFS